MRKAQNYLAYLDEVHAIRGDRRFKAFFASFNDAMSRWLNLMGISPYAVSEVRAIELAAFELSRQR
jgi:hypothetical protein